MTKRSEYDQWVLDWIEDEKAKGRKCFDVKLIGNKYYVYYQTTKFNPVSKKREKISSYLGKLTPEGLDEKGPKQDDEVKNVRYGLGVDTGGTFTDAVIVDMDDFTIVAKKKSPTTHEDLSIGLYNAVDGVLSESGIDPSQIVTVGISTTLATNSVLEDMGGRVGLILIGWNPSDPINFGEDKHAFIRGGYDSRGRAINSLNLEETTKAIMEVSKDVDAIAISGLFANVNATQERKVKKLAMDLTGLPTVAGHELSAELGIDLRAETAVLNGKLIPIVTKFFDDVRNTLDKKGITAPIMVYKGDGSVMTVDQAKLYPVQTILSGPAASSMGGKILCGKDNFIMVDIGGTSTDIAVVEEGFPQIQIKGAEVGGWRTLVEAVDMSTIALGGDSRITMQEQCFIFGPKRVMPLCRFTVNHPEIVPKIMHDNLYDYYLLKDDVDLSALDDRKRQIAEGMAGAGPMNRMDIMHASNGIWDVDDDVSEMVTLGLIEHTSLTPTDLLVYLNMLDMGNREGAQAGVHAVACKFGMTEKQAATLMLEEARTLIAEAVMEKLLNDRISRWKNEGSMKLVRRMSTSKKDVDVFEMRPKLTIPIVAIGAPSAFLMEDIGKRLGTKVIFPENHDVGNAIGAVSSKVVKSMSALVTPTNDFRFKLEVPYLGPSYYTNIDSAISAGRTSLEAFLKNEVEKNGGTNIKVTTKIKTVMATEGGVGDWEEEGVARNVNYVEILTRAVGNPPEVQ